MASPVPAESKYDVRHDSNLMTFPPTKKGEAALLFEFFDESGNKTGGMESSKDSYDDVSLALEFSYGATPGKPERCVGDEGSEVPCVIREVITVERKGNAVRNYKHALHNLLDSAGKVASTNSSEKKLMETSSFEEASKFSTR